jgi:hypothetical protein
MQWLPALNVPTCVTSSDLPGIDAMRLLGSAAWSNVLIWLPLLILLASLAGCQTLEMTDTPVSPTMGAYDQHAGPVMPWPRPVPVRLKPNGPDDLMIMTLGDVETPLADGIFDPVRDCVTLPDGTIIEDYYRTQLDIPFYAPIDKTIFPVPPSGWCTWYYYYQEITSDEVLVNARWLREHLQPYGCRYVQLDDGWQGTGHGLGENRDWTTIDVRFRDRGMAGLAKAIQDLGFDAGLWLAPHGQSNEQVARSSGVFLFKPDGTTASDTWEGTYLVDPSLPEGLDFLHDLFKTLHGWGYTYFKIDGQPIVIDEYRTKAEFMHGEMDDKRTPEERAPLLYRDTLRAIRTAIGEDSFLLGCWGIPLPGTGIMNGSRTAGDVWQAWSGCLVAVDAIGKWNFLHNIVWYCDPDTLLVRPPLTTGTARVWSTAQGLTGQALLTSDRMPDLPRSRVEMLKRVYPAADIRPLDLFRPDQPRKPIWDLKVNHLGRTYDVVGLFNFDTEEERVFHLRWSDLGLDPEQPFHVHDFWEGIYLGSWTAGVFLEVPPKDVRVVTFVPAAAEPVLISTSRHITQGWVELRSLTRERSAEGVAWRGSSKVIAGDPYVLTFGVSRESPTWEAVEATADGSFGTNVQTQIMNHQGACEIIINSDTTQVIDWSVAFGPAEVYAFAASSPSGLTARSAGLTGVEVAWNEHWYPLVGYQVFLDDVLVGTAFQPRVMLEGLTPDQTYTIQVASVAADGTPCETPISIEHTTAVPDTAYLAEWQPVLARQSWGALRRDRSVAGRPLTIAGEVFERGLGTHSASTLVYRTYGVFSRFEAKIGLDDESSRPEEPAEVVFSVWGDGRKLWESPTIRGGEGAIAVSVDITDVEELELRVEPGQYGIDYTHADWVEARVVR